jgi:alpha-galactosidase
MKLPLLLGIVFFTTSFIYAQKAKPPIMGWSSWNGFRVKIDEKLIREQADAMISSGLYDAGYRYINIDDGYFGGRDSSGNLFVNPKKFPSGMKALTDYIHSKQLKAGIYTDGGDNTCAFIGKREPFGKGVGMFGHISQDCNSFFNEWNFDFIKIDWCGGRNLKLDVEKTYRSIIDTALLFKKDVNINVCRWEFPGEWVIDKADSWRISTDINPKFSTVLMIIDKNADLYKYASPGHYNDMDMLEVGNGMSYEEDKAHFSMWCMMNSPLLSGNDLRKMNQQTIEILTNKELIALNQDQGFQQARRISTANKVEVWVKQLGRSNSKEYAVAILNRGDKETTYDLSAKLIHISPKAKIRDLWLHQDLGKLGNTRSVTLPIHGIVVLKLKG